MTTTAEQITKVISAYFGNTTTFLTIGNPTFETLGADSLDMVELCIHVEDELGIEIADEQMPTDLGMTVSDYVAAVGKLQQVAA